MGESCCVCFHSIDYELFECRHPCCRECWEEWRVENPTCPVCRAQIEPIDLPKLLTPFDEAIAIHLERPPSFLLQLLNVLFPIVAVWIVALVMLSLEKPMVDGFNDYVRFSIRLSNTLQTLLDPCAAVTSKSSVTP